MKQKKPKGWNKLIDKGRERIDKCRNKYEKTVNQLLWEK
jgi:hypothetical protein